MRKRRSDSPWNKLTPKQHELMDQWFFDEGLSHQQILKEAARAFGIKATQQTLTSYFRHREKVRAADNPPGWSKADDLLLKRTDGMKLEEMETRAFYFSAAAAYELSQAAPNKMRVKELRSLMKMLTDRRQTLGRVRENREKFELHKLVALAKLELQASKVQTKEGFEQTVFETADVLHRAKQKLAEQRAGLEADRKRREEASEAKDTGESQIRAADGVRCEKCEVSREETGPEDENPPAAGEEGGGEGEVYKAI